MPELPELPELPENDQPEVNNDLRQLLEELEKEAPVESSSKFKAPKKKGGGGGGGSGMVVIKPLKRKQAQPPLQFEQSERDLTEEMQNQFHNMVSRYSKISDEIIRTYERDRDQAQEVLDHFLNTLATGGKIPRVYVEKVADVLKSKNDISQIPIRMLDAITKFMSASKGNDILNQMNVSFDSNALTQLLETTDYDDEDVIP